LSVSRRPLTISGLALTYSQGELERFICHPALTKNRTKVYLNSPNQSLASSNATFFIRYSPFFAVTYGKYPLEGLLETVPGIGTNSINLIIFQS
jgi:hypothetical protein